MSRTFDTSSPTPTSTDEAKIHYLFQLADNALIMGQRLCEWTGVAPELEIDLALCNIALDHLGQANAWYEYLVEIYPQPTDVDQLAFCRDEHQYYNITLVELPNGDFAQTIAKMALFSIFNYYLHDVLRQCSDARIAAIAARSYKEIQYHRRYASNWLLRLGDGTDISHKRMQKALDIVWDHAFEAFTPSPADRIMHQQGIAPDLEQIKALWEDEVHQLLHKATLSIPDTGFTGYRAKSNGVHTEHMGYLLAEMQYMQRRYPNLQW